MAVMAFTGMTVAQDIYTSGYFKDSNGKKVAAVYKNGSILHQRIGSYDWSSTAVTVDASTGDVYWVANAMDGSTPLYGDVHKNGFVFLNTAASDGMHINDIKMGKGYLFSTGYKTISGKKVACYWRGNNTTPQQQMGNSSYNSEANALCFGAANDNYVFTGGYQYTSSSNYHGVVWKEGSVYHTFPNNSKILDIAWYNGNIISVGVVDSKLRVWRGETEIYQLVNSSADGRASIWVDGGDIYVASYGGSSPDILWKNGFQLYTTSGFFEVVRANTSGVYCAGSQTNAGKIWKNGSVLYTPSYCEKLYGLYVAEQECTNSEIRSLPFTEGFENGSTGWACWTKSDVDNNNDGYASYWDRAGEHPFNSSFAPATGNHCAYHRYGQASTVAQEGWLISPQLFLQPGRDYTTLTFKSCQPRADYYTSGGCSVWISTTGTSTSAFTKIWEETSASSSYKTITVNLKDYQGHAVYIAFKYNHPANPSGPHCWVIDDVSVTESWTVCAAEDVPYAFNFSAWPWQSTCWYNIDYDKSGDKRCWKYNSSEDCAYHPWGQAGLPQHGCLYSPNITLPAGHDYVLKFKTKSTSSGSYMSNEVFIRQDGTGTPATDQYGTMIWSDNQFSSSWTEVEVPLSAYAGHVISLEFNYHGYYAHNWFIKDVRVEQTIVQYTITANSNNNAWGSVSGGGTYNNGATCTLTATANTGYSFSKWQDNSTTNPRTITVTQNATYTATFTQDHYTVSVYASPASGGTVSGGGSNFTYGSTATLTATPASGYEFQGWSDGSTDNPHTVTVTGDATYTATFGEVGATYFTVTTSVTPEGSGTVTGGGTYEAGTSIVLTATPNTGYSFLRWSDGSTTNPRTLTVTNDMSYTALFEAEVYTIVVVANPTNGGTVTGSGTYTYGSTATLTATPASGYEFQGWSDGSTANPHQVTVTENATYTATFTPVGATYYTVSAVVSPAGSGSVTGTGVFAAGSTTTLRATANEGYTFKRWNDNSTMNPRQVTVNNNMSFTAFFEAQQYTITVNASPAAGGTVSGGGNYAYGATATLRATPNANYTFTQWADGVVQNPRTVTVTENATYTAVFSTAGGETYTLTLTVNDPSLGTVMGGGTYPAGTPVQIAAYPNAGAEFVKWSDGSTRNPRVVRLDSDMTLEAEFASAATYTITVNSADPTMGQAFGGGTFHAGETAQISAMANTGYEFVRWNDGNSDNPRTITVTGNATYTATFAAEGTETHRVILICNGDDGTVSGDGVYVHGTTATIQAFPATGREFDKWSDGSTDNPRTLTVNEDITLVAFFRVTGVDEFGVSYYELYPNPTNSVIRIAGIEPNTEVKIYNSIGMLVKVVSASSDDEISVTDLASGLYLVRFGNVSLRFVKTL